MVDSENGKLGILAVISMFSFISIIIIFLALINLGVMNNYATYTLYNTSKEMVNSGVMSSAFSSTIEVLGSSTLTILPYIDYLFIISFISLFISSLLYSYFSRRENYFTIFNFAVFGIIIFVYIGGIFVQLTEWFRDNVLLAVFPTYSSYLPFFTWYLNNIMIINLIIVSLCIIANFIHIDFDKYNKRKMGDSIDEI